MKYTLNKRALALVLAVLMVVGSINSIPVQTVYAGESVESATEMVLGQEYTVVLGEDEVAYYKFIPESTESYKIYSMGAYDTYVRIWDSYDNRVGSNDDGDEDYNFCYFSTLAAGECYYFEVGTYDESAEFQISIVSTATALELDYDTVVTMECEKDKKLEVEAISGQEVTYQWYYYDDVNEKFIILDGETNSSYTAKWQDEEISIYRCTVSNGTETKNADIRVERKAYKIVRYPSKYYGKVGEWIELKVNIEGNTESLSYEWWLEGDDDDIKITGETENTYRIQIEEGMEDDYYCIVIDEKEGTETSVWFDVIIESTDTKEIADISFTESNAFVLGVWDGSYITNSYPGGSSSIKVDYTDGTFEHISINNNCETWSNYTSGDAPGKYSYYVSYRGKVLKCDYIVINKIEENIENELIEEGMLEWQIDKDVRICSFMIPKNIAASECYARLSQASKNGKVTFIWTKGNRVNSNTTSFSWGLVNANPVIKENDIVKSLPALEPGKCYYMIFSSEDEDFSCKLQIGYKANILQHIEESLDLEETVTLSSSSIYKFVPQKNGYYYVNMGTNATATIYNDAGTQIAYLQAYDDLPTESAYLQAGKTYYIEFYSYLEQDFSIQNTRYADCDCKIAGMLGENVYWKLNEQGILTVEGTGEMNGCIEGYSFGLDVSKIVIGEGITGIGNYAFRDIGATELILSSTVKSIGQQAFYNCTEIKNISFSGQNNISSVGSGAFSHTAWYQSQQDDYILLDNILIKCLSEKEELYIPQEVQYMADYAVAYRRNAKKATIPGTVTDIAYRSFYECTALEQVIIEDGVQEISESAFEDCSSLKYIRVPSSVKKIEDCAIGYKIGIHPVWIDGEKTIRAGEKAENLPTIYCEEGSVAHTYALENGIPYKWLSEWPPVENTTNNNVNNNTGGNIENNTNNATNNSANNTNASDGNGNLNDDTENLSQLKKGSVVTVGASKYKITGNSTLAFIGLKNSKSKKVTIPKTIKVAKKTYKVTQIAAKAMKNQKKVTSVTIGANITTIGASAFEGCKKLSTITIKSTKLKSVGKKALKGIKSNAKIKVPAKKLSAYKKLLKGKGQGKKVKIKK